MLDANIKTQLKAYLERLQRPIELVASLDDSEKSQKCTACCGTSKSLSGKVAVRTDGSAELRPSFSVGRPGRRRG